MYFPVSDTIAGEHPDLRPAVEQLDSHLSENRGELIDMERVADFIDACDEAVLVNLFATYEQAGDLDRVNVQLCPDCHEVLSTDLDCDLCEGEFSKSEARPGVRFRPRDLGEPAPSDAVPTEYAVRQLTERLAGNHTEIHIKEFVMGDSYKGKQVGAMGPGAQATNFQQIWLDECSDINLQQLAGELASLRSEMRTSASGTVEEDRAIAAVGDAEELARGGDGAGTLKALKAEGKWALDTANKLGIALAAKAIGSALLGS